MAIRARIKSKIKSILFGSSTKSSNNGNQTSTTVSKTTFVAPSVSTDASQSETNTAESTTTVNASAKETTHPTVETTNVPEVTTAEANESDAVEQSSDTQSSVDDTEASFVFEIEELFPETCPHCGASSRNNWIRIENKFACGSCEAAY